jgi:hypothetical protein
LAPSVAAATARIRPESCNASATERRTTPEKETRRFPALWFALGRLEAALAHVARLTDGALVALLWTGGEP